MSELMIFDCEKAPLRGPQSLKPMALPGILTIVLHKGWFDDVLHEFASDNPGDIDYDLCSSTKTIFDYLGGRLKSWSLLIFIAPWPQSMSKIVAAQFGDCRCTPASAGMADAVRDLRSTLAPRHRCGP